MRESFSVLKIVSGNLINAEVDKKIYIKIDELHQKTWPEETYKRRKHSSADSVDEGI